MSPRKKILPDQKYKTLSAPRILLHVYLFILLVWIASFFFSDGETIFSFGGFSMDYGYIQGLLPIIAISNLICFPIYIMTKSRDPVNVIASYEIMFVSVCIIITFFYGLANIQIGG